MKLIELNSFFFPFDIDLSHPYIPIRPFRLRTVEACESMPQYSDWRLPFIREVPV
jgi:hypothetical protein